MWEPGIPAPNDLVLVLFQNSAHARIQSLQHVSLASTLGSRMTCRILARAGIDNRPIKGVPKPSAGVVRRHERLGGMLSHYYRRAA